MDVLEKFFQNNNLQDSEDIDSLLEFASLVRQLIVSKRYSDITGMILYTIERNYYEAFSWSMGILQEEFGRAECELENFECMLGKYIPDYNEFMQRLQVDVNAVKNDVETVRDENGEVESFFNIFTYKTGFENIYLVSAENFDTKDNDYIQYKLSFIRQCI